VKRKNHTLVEMARTMLDEHRTPKRFWAEEISTGCYILNQIFLRSFMNLTPFELHFGRFWAEAINTACYISNQIFMRSLLNLTPFKLHFGCQLSISYLREIGCKCFILKCGNLDKFELRSSDGIFLVYTPHGRSYRVLTLKTKILVESCDVTLDETTLCPRDVFESAGDKDMEKSIFVDEALQGFEGEEDEHIALASTSSPGHVPSSTLEAEAPQASTSSSVGV
jgi:hypothetical protein